LVPDKVHSLSKSTDFSSRYLLPTKKIIVDEGSHWMGISEIIILNICRTVNEENRGSSSTVEGLEWNEATTKGFNQKRVLLLL